MNQQAIILSDYEKSQVTEIEAWKKEEPGVISQAIGIVTSPITWVVEQIIPETAIKAALDLSNTIGNWLTDLDDIKRDGNVEIIEELKYKDLELSDRLADEVHNWAIGIAAAEGAGTGFLGIAGIAADIPLIITIALRTIHKIGACYGYETKTKEDYDFCLGVLSASGANSYQEKIASLQFLRSIEVILAKQTWEKIAGTVAQNQFSKEAGILLIKNLAKQLGINLTKRKAMAVIPVIGAAIGGSVNGWYLKEVGWAARRAFQERWLIDNQKIIDI